MNAPESQAPRDAFIAAFRELQEALETRRRRYLRRFFINCVIAAALLSLGLLYPRGSLEWIALKLGRSEPVTSAEVASLIFFSMVCSVSLVVSPYVGYRGGFREKHSLRNLALLRICEMLGNAVPGSSAVALAPMAAGSMLFPRDAGIAERHGICGETQHVKYVLQEMAVASAQQGRRAGVFRGVFILCSPKVRQPFHAVDDRRALVTMAGGHTPESLMARGWLRAVKLELPRLHALGFGGMANNAGHTHAAMIDESAIETLHMLAVHTEMMQNPETRTDSRIWGDLELFITKLKDTLTGGFARQAIEAERAYDAQFCVPPKMHRRMRDERRVKNNFIGLSAFEGRLAVALGGPDFLTGQVTLFAPMFSEDAISYLYDLLNWIESVRI